MLSPCVLSYLQRCLYPRPPLPSGPHIGDVVVGTDEALLGTGFSRIRYATEKWHYSCLVGQPPEGYPTKLEWPQSFPDISLCFRASPDSYFGPGPNPWICPPPPSPKGETASLRIATHAPPASCRWAARAGLVVLDKEKLQSTGNLQH
jgi:hypothetical protein